MVVDDDDFSDHADRIENDYNDEISRRCVMSRKYYAAFHYVRENGRSHSNSNFSNGGSDHQEAQKFLRSINQGQLAQKLFRLHKWEKKLIMTSIIIYQTVTYNILRIYMGIL